MLFNGFRAAEQTVETVGKFMGSSITGLKPGENEMKAFDASR